MKTKNHPSKSSLTLLFAVVLALLLGSPTHLRAAAWVWNANTSSNWNVASSWLPASIPARATDTDLYFYTNGAAFVTTMVIGYTTTAPNWFTNRSLNFTNAEAPDLTIQFTTLLNGSTADHIAMDGGGAGAAINVAAGTTNNITLGSTAFGTVKLQDNLTITHNGSGTLTFARPIQNSAVGANFGITKEGGGAVVFSGANTYSNGVTTVNAGALTLSGANTAAFNGGVILNGGATLNLNNAPALGAGSLTINGGTINNNSAGNIVINSGVTYNFNGNFTWGGTKLLNLGSANTVNLQTNCTITTSGGNWFVISGPVNGPYSLTRDGAANFLSMAGAGDYSGGTVQKGGGGGLLLGADNVLGTGTLSISNANSSISSSGTAARILTNAVVFATGHTLGDAARTGKLTFSGPVQILGSQRTLNIKSDVEFSGSIGGDSGIYKAFTGLLTLSGNNTYPLGTTISAGTLALGAGGSIASSAFINLTAATATFDVSAVSFTLGSSQPLMGKGIVMGDVAVDAGGTIVPGGSNVVDTLTFNNHLSLTNSTLLFDITDSANADKLIVAGDLTPTGVTTISLPNSTPLTNGDYTLIEVSGTLGGGTTNFTVTSPSPAKTYVIAYQAGTPNKVVLTVTGAADLTWTGSDGAASNVWDIATTQNWLASGVASVFNNNDLVTFDDAGSTNPVVNISATVQPTTVTVNSASDYSFTGTGKISGTTVLNKSGGGALTVSTANDYTGGTVVNNGTLKLGADHVLGTGTLTLSGAGTKLSSDSGTARLLTNNLMVTASTTFGDMVNSGTLTLGGVVDLGGLTAGTRLITNDSKVVVVGTLTNGSTSGTFALQKHGIGDLVVLGSANLSAGVATYVRGGSLIVDGASLTLNGATLQVAGVISDSVCRVVVTNGGSLYMTNASGVNWRAGVNAFGSSTTTNIFDIAGTVRGLNATYGATANGIYLGAGGTIGIVNLWPGGLLEVRNIMPSDTGAAAANSEVNFRGGTLKAYTNNTANFMQNLTNCFVGSGGGTIDTTNWNVTIDQALLDGSVASPSIGSGSLTKIGSGTLTLAGVNTYAGSTTVSNGTLLINGNSSAATGAVAVRSGATLGGSGTIGGAVTFDAGAKAVFTLGSPLTLSSSLTIAGSTDVHLNLTNDVPAGNYTLATYSGGSSSFNSTPVLGSGTFAGGTTASIVTSGGNVALQVVTSGPAALTWTGSAGALSNVWDIATTANWLASGLPAVFNDGAPVVFDDTGSTNSIVDIISVVSPSSVTVNSTSDYTFMGSGGISGLVGTNTLSKIGSGLLTIACANAYVNDTIIGQGVLVADNLNALGNSRVQFNPGVGATLRLAQSLNLNSNLTMTIANGAYCDLGGSGTTLTITSAGNFTSGLVFTNAGKIVKSGPGRMTLIGDSTHTGGITVNSGILRIGNGTSVGTLTSDITVQTGAALDVLLAPGFALVSGQTLAGSGVVTGAVTVASGSLLRPGLGGVDTTPLTFKHALTLDAGSTNVIAINRTNAPSNAAGLVVAATLTQGGELTVTNVGPALVAGDTFTLLSAASLTSNFSVTNLPSLETGLKWDWTNGVLTVVASTATTPTNIVFSATSTTLSLTWPGSHLGWYAQSNAVDLADTNYWFNIPGSETVTNLDIAIDPAQPNVFYRLRMP